LAGVSGINLTDCDIDLMVISEKVAYDDLFAALEPATQRLHGATPLQAA
jgi:hypothetical protein